MYECSSCVVVGNLSSRPKYNKVGCRRWEDVLLGSLLACLFACYVASHSSRQQSFGSACLLQHVW
jgi:hypothetical protein